MKSCAGIVAVPLLFLPTACAPVQPKPDPLEEEVIILQKQFLQLQKLQSETRTRLDESTAVVNSRSAIIAVLEERQAIRPTVPLAASSAPAAVSGSTGQKIRFNQKTVKTIKKVRRQE